MDNIILDNELTPRASLIATDLEGILFPEMWVAVAEKTGTAELKLTTRDIADYDELMRMRLDVLRHTGLGLADVQAIIRELEPLPGAEHFLEEVRRLAPLVVITDSFYEFVNPVVDKLDYVTVFAHTLEVSEAGEITGYGLRLQQGKRKTLRAFHDLGFRTIAVGDSYNDIAMLLEATESVLFRPPQNVCDDYPMIPAVYDYETLSARIRMFVARTDVTAT
jgi:phosphoserine / homoserine phosphotransferase